MSESKLCHDCCFEEGCKIASGFDSSQLTKVKDPALDSDGNPVQPGGVAPYERPAETGCFTVDCTHAHPSSNPNCGPWRQFPNSTEKPADVISGGTFDTAFNSYGSTATPAEANRTCGVGHKNKLAHVVHYGRYGFTSENNAPFTTVVLDGDQPTELCRGEKMTQDQVKYLSARAQLTYSEITTCIPDYDYSGTFDGKVNISKTTGQRTIEWSAPDSDFPISGSGESNFNSYVAQAIAYADGNSDAIASDFLIRAASLHWGNPAYSIVRDGFTWTETIVSTGNVNRVITLDVEGGYFQDIRSGFKCTNCECANDEEGGTSEWDVLRTETFSVSNTTIEWTILDVTDMLTAELNVQISLENSYLWSEVQAATQALLDASYVDLEDDLKYPSRNDGYLSIGPLLTPAQVQGSVFPSLSDIPLTGQVNNYHVPTVGGGTELDNYSEWEQMGWFDPACYRWSTGNVGTEIATLEGPFYNGGVVGALGPVGANSFSFDHVNRGCDGTPCVTGYGASAHSSPGDVSAVVVPKTATNWTNLVQAALIPPGNVVMHFNGGCLIQECWQLDAASKAQNWSRPCGKDSALMDEGTVRCILSSECVTTVEGVCVEANFVLNVADLSDPGFAGGWKVTVVNEDGMEGLWTVTAVDTGTPDEVHVTATRDGDLPAGFTRGTESVMGRRRYSTAAACDSALDNTTRRGDYAILSWVMEYRFLERDRAIALASEDCPAGGDAIRTNPINNAIGRNVASFTAVQNDFSTNAGNSKCRVLRPAQAPATIADERYATVNGGVLFQSVVMNVMAEVFWQPPAKSCEAQDAEGVWTEDPLGACRNDDPPEFFYPQRPWVEMRLSPPAGVSGWTSETWGGYSKTDDLGKKVYLGFVNLSFEGDITDLPVAPPISTPTYCGGLAAEQTSPLLVPWTVLANECNCIGSGRFSEAYALQTNCCV